MVCWPYAAFRSTFVDEYNFSWEILVLNHLNGRVGVMTQQAELLLGMSAFYIGLMITVLASLFLIQLPGHSLEKAVEGGPRTWAPATPSGSSYGVPGC